MDLPSQLWQELLLPQGNPDYLWEIFHENSKITPFSTGPSEQFVTDRMEELHESLEFTGYPIVKLPYDRVKLKALLQKTILTRFSARNFAPGSLNLKELATLLHHAYGITRENKRHDFPRPFRVVPSGGALYPLEIFFSSSRVKNLESGLYHYNPTKHHLRFLKKGNQTPLISKATPFPDLVTKSSLLIFITALFERSVFKYGDRGYRFVFLEAGHVAQNVNLVCSALGLGSVNIGGFYDREMDEFLGLDGITHSTIYIISVGKNNKRRFGSKKS